MHGRTSGYSGAPWACSTDWAIAPARSRCSTSSPVGCVPIWMWNRRPKPSPSRTRFVRTSRHPSNGRSLAGESRASLGLMPSAAVASILKTTPFHPRTGPLVRAQTWRRWAGYQVASAYEPHPDREYAAVRNAAALFDVSPLYKYLIRGRDSARLLDRMVTRDVARCAIGQVLYTPWCDAHGKVIDDGTISRLDETTFRLTSAEPNVRWLTMNAVGLDVTIEEVSARIGALALQGPLSRAILQQLS